MRRSSYTDRAVNYGAVGASLSPDIMRYPPQGFRSRESRIRLGSGVERFVTARDDLLSWRVPVLSGVDITDVTAGIGEGYRGLGYSEEDDLADSYTPEGWPYVNPGATVSQRIGGRIDAPVRVVYVVDEPHRVAYGVGTLDGHPLVGEEAFIVTLEDEESVWFTVRSFSHPATIWGRVFMPFVWWSQRRLTQRFLRALHPATD